MYLCERRWGGILGKRPPRYVVAASAVLDDRGVLRLRLSRSSAANAVLRQNLLEQRVQLAVLVGLRFRQTIDAEAAHGDAEVGLNGVVTDMRLDQRRDGVGVDVLRGLGLRNDGLCNDGLRLVRKPDAEPVIGLNVRDDGDLSLIGLLSAEQYVTGRDKGLAEKLSSDHEKSPLKSLGR